VRINRGQSAILRDGNEIAFGSPKQEQSSPDDYRFIYRHLAAMDLTGVHALYDMKHELGRGTFTTVMKAISRTTGEWWAIKIIHTRKLRATNNGSNDNNNDNNGGENNDNNSKDSAHFASLAREVSILEELNHPNICRLREKFVPDARGNDFCKCFFFPILGWVGRRALTLTRLVQTWCWNI
jgi:serine/threonine/tyrosine protein kinase RAD53